MWFGPIIYHIFSLPAPSKTSLFDTSKQPKCKSFLRGASDAAPGLQNGAPWAEKWRDWGPPGSPRVPKGLAMLPKMLPKIVPKSAFSPGLPPRVLPRCLGYPPRPQNTVILVDQLSQAAARDNRFTDILLHSTHFLALKSIEFFGGSRASGALSRCMCALLPEPGYRVCLSVFGNPICTNSFPMLANIGITAYHDPPPFLLREGGRRDLLRACLQHFPFIMKTKFWQLSVPCRGCHGSFVKYWSAM